MEFDFKWLDLYLDLKKLLTHPAEIFSALHCPQNGQKWPEMAKYLVLCSRQRPCIYTWLPKLHPAHSAVYHFRHWHSVALQLPT